MQSPKEVSHSALQTVCLILDLSPCADEPSVEVKPTSAAVGYFGAEFAFASCQLRDTEHASSKQQPQKRAGFHLRVRLALSNHCAWRKGFAAAGD